MSKQPMVRAALAAVLGVTAAPVGSAVEAQQAQVEARAGRVTDERGGDHTGLTLAPALAWVTPAGRLQLAGQATAFQGGGALGSAAIRGATTLASLGAVAVAVEADGRVAASSADYRAAGGGLAPALRIARAGWGVEAGAHLERGGESFGAAGRAPGSGLLPFGRRDQGTRMLWRSARGVHAGAWLETESTGARAGWRSTTAGESAWREWSGALVAVRDRLTLGVSGGVRTGDVAERWMGASAALAVTAGAAVVGELGRAPSDPLLGRRGGSYASLGVRLRSGGAPRAAPVLPAAAPDGQRVALSARPGAEVEVLGDWNGWEPQRVPETAPGEYALQLRLPAGVYRFAFRVDGRWRVPAGMETEPDGYGGRRAVLRVRSEATNH